MGKEFVLEVINVDSFILTLKPLFLCVYSRDLPHLLLFLPGQQFVVARDDKLSAASLLLFQVYVLILCFEDSGEMKTTTKALSTNNTEGKDIKTKPC